MKYIVEMPDAETIARLKSQTNKSFASEEPYFPQLNDRLMISNLTNGAVETLKAADARISRDVRYVSYAIDPLSEICEFCDKDWESFLNKKVDSSKDHRQEPLGLDRILELIKAPTAWKNGYDGKGVIIIIIDSGVCSETAEIPEAKRVHIPLDIARGDSSWIDDMGHGTMSAVLAAGVKEENGKPGGKFNGVAPGASIFSIRTNFWESDIIKIYDSIIEMRLNGILKDKPVVICHNFGAKDYCNAPEISDEILRGVLKANSLNMPVVAPAGNSHLFCGNEPSSITPSTIWGINSRNEVLCVSTVDHELSNTSNTPHSGSSRGPGQFDESVGGQAHPKPDCVVPTGGEINWGCDYHKKAWWGTSGAGAMACGLVALILSKDPKLSPKQIFEIIRKSCKPLDADHRVVGHGVIDCEAATSSKFYN